MTSLRARTLIWLLRNRHLFKGRFRPEPVGPGFDVAGFRAATERPVARMKLPRGVREEPVTVAGMAGAWLIPEAAARDGALFYVHGGGFISGGVASHRIHVARFARACGCRALVFDYRLAPEHPFPAAPDDVRAAWDWLIARGHAPDRVVVGGESAGATLALALLGDLARGGAAMPAGAFAISAVTDLSLGAASFASNAGRDIAPPGAAAYWVGLYRAGADPGDPRLSPLFADMAGFPPLHLCVGGDEIHRDDMRALAAKAAAAGVAVRFDEAPGMVHAFPLLAPLFPEATAGFDAVCGFVRDRLA